MLRGRVRDFRIAALIGGVLPLPLALAVSTLELSRNVGLVFAVAASTLCPLLLLGIWWRGLTAVGAVCGLAAGGLVSGTAAVLTLAGGIDEDLLGGWPAVLTGYPAAQAFRWPSQPWWWSASSTRASADTPRDLRPHASTRRLGMSVERVPGD